VRTGAARPFGPTGKPVAAAHFNPTSTAIVYVSGHFVRLVDLASGADRVILPEQPEDVLWGALEPTEGIRIVTAGRDNLVKFWDLPYAQPSVQTARQTADLATAAYSPDGTLMVTASVDGSAVVWNASTGLPVVTLEVQSARLRSAMFSPDGTKVVTADEEGVASVFDATSGALLVSLAGEGGHSGSVRSAVFSPDGTRVLTAGEDGTIKIWQL
jgi:WD40 repeat protein